MAKAAIGQKKRLYGSNRRWLSRSRLTGLEFKVKFDLKEKMDAPRSDDRYRAALKKQCRSGL